MVTLDTFPMENNLRQHMSYVLLICMFPLNFNILYFTIFLPLKCYSLPFSLLLTDFSYTEIIFNSWFLIISPQIKQECY